ncbi:unnamed protein product [Citrullus colocynthis]|uniref:X8 domain-containing protein n=1 Tax=Citrullus colocynthis TaxID=252529 RepID=A0ABP0XWL9_9ROSI
MSSSSCLVILHLSLLLIFIITPTRTEGEYDQEWCIADEQVPDDELQRALDWACGKGGADCRNIQVKQPCFYPNTVRDHASYAFNSYYQKFKHKGATCYFNSAAMVTALDPSHGSCKFEYVP